MQHLRVHLQPFHFRGYWKIMSRKVDKGEIRKGSLKLGRVAQFVDYCFQSKGKRTRYINWVERDC